VLGIIMLMLTPAQASGVPAIVTAKAQQHGVPPALAHGVAKTESGYRCNVRGSAGELGAMQVKPATARGVGVTGNLRDCETGIEAGMRYLKLALAKARGSWASAAKLYNAGLGASLAPSSYSNKVLRNASIQ
jgi:soluble lytic murein transglycosylase-like protein